MIGGTIQLEDMLSAQKKHAVGRKSLWISIALVLAALAYSAWFVLEWPETLEVLGWVWLLVAVLIPIQLFLFRRNIRKSYFQRKDLQRPASFEPSDDGLIAQTEHAKAFKPWSDYLKWSESHAVFLLYMSDNVFQIVPKHFFSSPAEIEEFRAILRSRIQRAGA